MPVRYSSFSLENIYTFAPACAADSCAVRNWALSCSWAPEIPGAYGHGVHGGQGRFWPFIKWTNIAKQYSDFTTTLTSCKTWELAPFNLVSVGIIAAAFQLFSICGAQNVFQEQICWTLLVLTAAWMSWPWSHFSGNLWAILQNPGSCGFCSKSHFLLKEIVLS